MNEWRGKTVSSAPFSIPFIMDVILWNLIWPGNVPGLLQTFARSLCTNAWAQNDAHFRMFIFSSQNQQPLFPLKTQIQLSWQLIVQATLKKKTNRTVLLVLWGFKIRAQYLPFSAPSSLKNGALLEDMGEHWRYSSKLAEPQWCLVLVTTHNSQCLQEPVPQGRLKWNHFHFKQRPGRRTSSNYIKC